MILLLHKSLSGMQEFGVFGQAICSESSIATLIYIYV